MDPILLKDELLKRARRSGRHIVETLKDPDKEPQYIGDKGSCPVCHSSVLEISRKSKPVICAVCGVEGTLNTKGDDYVLEVTEEAKARSHFLLSGKFHHAEELKNVSLKPDPRMAEIPTLIQKYRSYLTYSKPVHAKG